MKQVLHALVTLLLGVFAAAFLSCVAVLVVAYPWIIFGPLALGVTIILGIAMRELIGLD